MGKPIMITIILIVNIDFIAYVFKEVIPYLSRVEGLLNLQLSFYPKSYLSSPVYSVMIRKLTQLRKKSFTHIV